MNEYLAAQPEDKVHCGSEDHDHHHDHHDHGRALISTADSGDCSDVRTNPLPKYAPSQGLYQLPVVVHVLTNGAIGNHIDLPCVQGAIEQLNDAFRARGKNSGGVDTQIDFVLATTDPCMPVCGANPSVVDLRELCSHASSGTVSEQTAPPPPA